MQEKKDSVGCYFLCILYKESCVLHIFKKSLSVREKVTPRLRTEELAFKITILHKGPGFIIHYSEHFDKINYTNFS